MAVTKYSIMKYSSIYSDSAGNYYPDIFTFPINDFSYTEKPMEYYLEEQDIERFDILMSRYYGSSNYDSYVLWLNKIEHIADVAVGTKIYLPSKSDIDTFISDNLT